MCYGLLLLGVCVVECVCVFVRVNTVCFVVIHGLMSYGCDCMVSYMLLKCCLMLCVSFVMYNVSVPGLFVCACLSDCVCLTFTVCVWFVCALLCDVVCLVVVMCCM